MSREQIIQWAEGQCARVPKPGYCTGPRRFGPSCYDCSGFTFMAYRAAGLMIPADSSLVARWGREEGTVVALNKCKLATLVIHDKYGDPYNSTGPRGHIGLFVRASGDRVITYESAGSGRGVGVYSRPASFWSIGVDHPALIGPNPPPVTPEEDMKRIIKGDQFEDRWVTDWITKRHIGTRPGFDAEARKERDAIIQAGVTQGAGEVTWPQAWVETIPVQH